MWVLYIVESKTGKLYTGITTDIKRRLAEHSSGQRGAKFFRMEKPKRIVYQEAIGNRSKALRREREIKNLDRKAKQKLIQRIAFPAAQPEDQAH